MPNLEPLSQMTDREWDDALASAGGGMLYQRSAWLRFLQGSQPGSELCRFRIAGDDGDGLGFFAGLLQRQGPILLMGSPLSGWFTDFMGPAAAAELDVPGFLKALERWCRGAGVSFIQLGHPRLSPSLMSAAGYKATELRLYRMDLCGDEEAQWNGLTSKCRNRIRKGIASGLDVERCLDGEIVDAYYAQHVEVFARQHLPPKYRKGLVRCLVENLAADDLILALRIVYRGECIGTGLFVHDDSDLYSFGIASKGDRRHLCPSELLYWSAIRFGLERRCSTFWMGGPYREPPSGGVFKEKFNPESVPMFRFAKALGPVSEFAHSAYRCGSAGRRTLRRLSAVLGARRRRGHDV